MFKLSTHLSEDHPRRRVETAGRTLEAIDTLARHDDCRRLIFVIREILKGEPSKEQADSIRKAIDKIIMMEETRDEIQFIIFNS